MRTVAEMVPGSKKHLFENWLYVEMQLTGIATDQKLTGEMGAIVWAIDLRCARKGEITTFWSQSNKQITKINASGTNLSGDKIVP